MSNKLAVFSAKPYDKEYLNRGLEQRAESSPKLEIVFHSVSLSTATAALADGATAVCAFVNDDLSEPVLSTLASMGVRSILMRCAGYNNVDLDAAARLNLSVANVPAYSPEAVAEFAVALVQTLNRKTHRAYNRVREGNFNLDGLLGKTLHGRTVGVLGVGRIGLAFAKIMKGFGCTLLAYDPFPIKEFEQYGSYVSLDELLPRCDIISMHCPLMEKTRHIINADTLAKVKEGAMLVNTSRGGLIDTGAVISALKSGRLGALALDVYEGESALFYNDHSGDIIQDDMFSRLMTFPNVLVCGHQAFFTEEALTEISSCTLRNLDELISGKDCKNSLILKEVKKEDIKKIQRRESLPVRTV